MSKIINTFNISIYQELIKRFNYDLKQLEKYFVINEKMIGYFDKKDFDYIECIYIDDLQDIINSNLFKTFIPSRVNKEINKIIEGIKVQKNTKNYSRCIQNFKKIFEMINIKLENYDNLA